MKILIKVLKGDECEVEVGSCFCTKNLVEKGRFSALNYVPFNPIFSNVL